MPVIESELTVTAEVPVELTVSGSDLVVPSVTLPKARLEALNATCGWVVATPVPARVINAWLPVFELLLIVNFPASVPAVFGANSI